MNIITSLLALLIFSCTTVLPFCTMCGPSKGAVEQQSVDKTQKSDTDFCDDVVSFTKQMCNRCFGCISETEESLWKNFTPDYHITEQTDADEKVIERMRPYYFEKEDRSIGQNIYDLFVGLDPYAQRQEKVYKRCINEAQAQEVMLLTNDNMRISSLFYKRDDAPINILYVTGYFGRQTPTKEWSAPFAQIFNDCNILSFDWRGYSSSEGHPSEFDIKAYPDIQAGIDFLRKDNDKPVVLVGFCFGAAMVLHTTTNALENGHRTADALVLNSTPTYMENMKKRAAQLAPNWVLQKFFSYQLSQDYILHHMAGNLFSLEPKTMVKKINLPILIESYVYDESVPTVECIELYNATMHEKSKMLISEIGGHVRIHTKVPDQYRTVFLDFVRQAGLLSDERFALMTSTTPAA